MELKINKKKRRDMTSREYSCLSQFPKNGAPVVDLTETFFALVHDGVVVIYENGKDDRLFFAQAYLGPFWAGSLGTVADTPIARKVFDRLEGYLEEQGWLAEQKEERSLEILSLLEKEFSDDAGRQLPESSGPDELP